MSILRIKKPPPLDPSMPTAPIAEPTTASAPLSVRVLSDESSWFTMRDEWNGLLDDSVYPNVFLRWEWQTTWWESFKCGRRLCILLVENGAELVGIAPFYRTKTGRTGLTRSNRLQCIGYGGPVSPEYLGPIIRRGCADAVCPVLANHLAARDDWDELFFEDYALDDPGTIALVDILRASHFAIVAPGEPRYHISLPSSYNEYLGTLSAHNRKRKRDRFRQAAAKHDASIVSLSPAAIDFWFPWIIRLSEKARLRTRQTSPFLREDYSSFHRRVLSRLIPRELASVFLLILDGQPSAFWYLLQYRGKYYAYQTGFDDSRQGSPGDVSLQMVLMCAIEDRFAEFDFLRGQHEYKQAYTDVVRHTKRVTIFRRHSLNFARRWLLDRFLRPARAGVKNFLPRGRR